MSSTATPAKTKSSATSASTSLWATTTTIISSAAMPSTYLYGGKGLDYLDGSLGNDYLYGQEDYDYLMDDVALKSDSGSNYLSTSYLGVGWFDRFVQDMSLRTEARYSLRTRLFAQPHGDDRYLRRRRRTETRSTAQSSATCKTLSRSEAIVMPDYVRSLADNVVNVDRANTWFQGSPFGQSLCRRLGDHLDKLVDKWFLGLDRPLAQYEDVKRRHANRAYQYVQGSLFQNGISLHRHQSGSGRRLLFPGRSGLAGPAESADDPIYVHRQRRRHIHRPLL